VGGGAGGIRADEEAAFFLVERMRGLYGLMGPGEGERDLALVGFDEAFFGGEREESMSSFSVGHACSGSRRHTPSTIPSFQYMNHLSHTLRDTPGSIASLSAAEG
jgi:hypothetical protein